MPLPQFEPKKEPEDPIGDERKRLLAVVEDIPLRVGIHAGKGGVGKTFLSTQLAMLLAKRGRATGLIDADVDCPNVPDALNRTEELKVTESGKLAPIDHAGVKVVSTGFMQGPDEPIIIRGPIKHRLLTDFVERTDWGDLDALVFDFPPGTSDVPLSAMQVANLTGIILISTPQKAALSDLRRAANMARRLQVPVYGVVENMSGDVFGEGTVETVAEELGLPFVCSIPLDAEIRTTAEEGKPALPAAVQDKLLAALQR